MMDADTKGFMENGFGTDFSGIKSILVMKRCK
jgi:hypothetical protein